MLQAHVSWPLFCGSSRNVDIETLKLFCDVIQLKGFTQAAAANSITQSAVSQRIKSLEQRFGLPLIERHGSELRLTKAGEIIHKSAKRILAEFREVEERMEEMKGKEGGIVRLAAIYSVGLYELDPFLKKFLKAHPKIDVHIEYGRASKIYQDVANDSIDLGIVAYPTQRPQLGCVPLSNDELVLICRPDHPLFQENSISIKRLDAQPFVAFHREIPTRKAIDEIFKHQEVSVIIKAEFDNIELIKRAVEIGLGVSVVPSVTVKSEIQTGLLKAVGLSEGPFMRPISVLYRRGRSLPLGVMKFLDVLAGDSPTPSPDSGHSRV